MQFSYDWGNLNFKIVTLNAISHNENEMTQWKFECKADFPTYFLKIKMTKTLSVLQYILTIIRKSKVHKTKTVSLFNTEKYCKRQFGLRKIFFCSCDWFLPSSFYNNKEFFNIHGISMH